MITEETKEATNNNDLQGVKPVEGETVAQILEASAAVDALGGVKGMPMKLSYKFGKLKRDCKKYTEAYQEAVNNKRDEMSKNIEDPRTGETTYGIPPEKVNDYSKATKRLSENPEPDFKPDKIKLTELEDLEDDVKKQISQSVITGLVTGNVLLEK